MRCVWTPALGELPLVCHASSALPTVSEHLLGVMLFDCRSARLVAHSGFFPLRVKRSETGMNQACGLYLYVLPWCYTEDVCYIYKMTRHRVLIREKDSNLNWRGNKWAMRSAQIHCFILKLETRKDPV